MLYNGVLEFEESQTDSEMMMEDPKGVHEALNGEQSRRWREAME